MRNRFIYILLTLVVLTSCNNDDDSATDEVQEIDITDSNSLIGVWRFKSITASLETDVNSDGIKNLDLFLELQDCYVDNIFRFEPNSVYRFVDEFEKCDSEKYNLTEGSFGIENGSEFGNRVTFNPSGTINNGFLWNRLKELKDPAEPDTRFIRFRATPTDLGLLSGGFGEAGFADVILFKQ